MFKVFRVLAENKAKIDAVIQDDVVSRQSIFVKDAAALGFPPPSTLVLVEGEEQAVGRAADLFKGVGEEVLADTAAAVRQKIRDQEDDVAAGVGLVFG